ncbi:MAG: helix-turn-helix transcriptional regulator [Vicinamibacterales bacterium]
MDRLPYGVLFLSDPGRLEYANRAATAILRNEDGLSLADGRLRAATADASARLLEAVTAAHRGDDARAGDPVLMLERPSGTRSLVLLIAVSRIDGAEFEPAPVVVYVTDPELTPSEARLLLILVEGLSARDAAARLGISYETVKARLNTRFTKTGTRRQPDLMRLVLSSTPPRIA